MKKHISLLLALMMIFTMLPMGMTVVSATTTVTSSAATDSNSDGVYEISTLQSEITLTFEEAITEEQAAEIILSKVSGNEEVEIKGAIIPTLAEDGLTYTLEFGRLEDNTTYKLFVPAADTTFTYLATEPGYDLNTDMSDISVDETGVINDSRFTYTSGKMANYTIVTDGNNKYMQLNQAAVDTEAAASFTLGLSSKLHSSSATNYNKVLTEERDVYIIDAAMKSYGKDGAAETPVSNTSKTIFAVTNSKSPFTWDNGSNVIKTSTTLAYFENTADAGIELGRDANGWTHIRTVMREDGRKGGGNTTPSVTGTTEIALNDPYNNLEGSEKYMGATTAAGTSPASTNKSEFIIANFWINKGADNTNNCIAVDYVRVKKDKAMKILKADGYAKNDKKVVFHMSDDIDENTVTEEIIAVTDAEGAAVTGYSVDADNTNRTITVSFPDGLGAAGTESTYTVDLSDVLGANGVAAYNNEYYIEETVNEDETTTKAYVNRYLAKPTFTVAAEHAGEVPKVKSYTIGDGSESISVHVGEATLTYDAELDGETLDGISIVSVDETGTETEAKGKIFPSLSDDKKTVTLTFGRLAAGAHKIKIAGVETLAGDAAKAEDIEFTTVEEMRVDVNTEFTGDSYVTGSAAPTETGLTYTHTVKTEGFQATEVIADGTDDKAVALRLETDGSSYTQGTTLSVSTSAYFKNDLTDERDVYVIDTAVKTYTVDDSTTADAQDEGYGEKTAFIADSNAAAPKFLSKFATGNILKTPGSTFASRNPKTPSLKQYINTELGAGSDWKKLRAVIKMSGEYGASATTPVKPSTLSGTGTTPLEVAELYDVTGETPLYYGESTASALNNKTYKVAYIGSGWITADYSSIYAADATSIDDRIAVDYVYARKDKAMTVLEKELSYTSANKQIKFYMTDDIDAASKENVVVKNSDGTAIDRTVTVDAAERSVTIAFDGLTAGNYTVDLGGVIGTNGVAVYDGKYVWDTTYTGTDVAGYYHEDLATYSFTVAEADGAFNVSGVTADGVEIESTTAEIDPDAFGIEIEFSGELAADAKDYITFTKNGAAIGGKLIKEQSGNTVTLTFGRLEEGANYILTIPATVKSEAGAAVTPATYTLTAKRTYEIQNDFSSLTADTVLHNADNAWTASNRTGQIRTASNFNTTLGNDNFAIVFDGVVTAKKTSDNDTYLEMKPYSSSQTSVRTGAFLVPKTASGAATTLEGKYFDTDNSNYEGAEGYVLAMDATMNTQTIDTTGTAMHLTSVLGLSDTAVAKFQGSGAMGQLKSFYNASLGGIKLDPAYSFNSLTDGEFNTARMVVSTPDLAAANNTVTSGEGTTDSPYKYEVAKLLTYKLYDIDEEAYVGSMDSVAVAKQSWIPYVDLGVQTVSETYNPGSSNVKINLTDFGVFYAKAMDVIDTQFDGEKLTIALTDAIDAETAENIVIESQSGAVLDSTTYTVVCDEEDRTIEVTFDLGLAEAGTYSVSLSGVEPKNGLADGTASTTFEVLEGSTNYITGVTWTAAATVDGAFLPLVKDGEEAVEGESIAIENAAAVKVDATIGTSGDTTPVVFLALYDKDSGKLINVAVATAGEATDAGVPYSATVTGLSEAVNEEVKLLVWEGTATIAPLFRPLQRL